MRHFEVVIAGRDVERGREVVEEIRKRGRNGLFVGTDVADRGAVLNLVRTTIAHHGRIDAAFNHAASLGA